MPASRSLDVVIASWNGCARLLDCLEHLERDDTAHTVIIVDNGSTDGTVAAVRERFPRARLLELPENLGFGKAVNRGIRDGEAEFVVLLNNDANVEPGFLAGLAAPFDDDRVGMVAGVLVRPGSDEIDAAGVEIDRGLAGSSYMRGLSVDRLAAPPAGLIGPCGGAAAYRRSALEQSGLFDEQLFAYSEDVDLALRLASRGWRCVLATGARAEHIGSATLGVRSARQVSIASYSRGYVLGRYRVGPLWVATELVVGLADCALLRSSAPVRCRAQGWIRGRRLPARSAAAVVTSGAIGWRASLGRRLGAARAPST